MHKSLLFTLISCLFIFLSSTAQDLDTTLWVTDGVVHAVARSNNTIYLGGDFKYVGPNTGTGAALDRNTGLLATQQFSHVNGDINAVVPDGKGGWFIGGEFTRVQGVPQHGLAHILADGNLDKAWSVDKNEADKSNSIRVDALYLYGNELYVGGSFARINGQLRSYLAKLNATTAELFEWAPDSNGDVLTMTVANNTLYVGGNFTYISKTTRSYCAAFDLTTGALTEWKPSLNRYPRCMVIAGEVAYLGGMFTVVGNQARNHLAAVRLDTGQPTSWNPNANFYVNTLAHQGDTVYAGGYFQQIAGAQRKGFAALDATTGQLLPWDPGIDGSVDALLLTDNLLYIGGSYSLRGTRRFLAAFDLSKGQSTAWDPKPTSAVLALASSGNAIYAGGFFQSIGGYRRTNVAALNATTGMPTNWNPSVGGTVKAMVVHNDRVYLGGNIVHVNDQTRYNLAAVDAVSGQLLAWNPGSDLGTVNSIAIYGSTAYLGGDFLRMKGVARSYLAAVDLVTGALTDWNPSISGYGHVFDLKIVKGLLYIGGSFNNIGGQTRNGLAAVDLKSGQPTSWNPNPNGLVKVIFPADSVLYVGGSFTTVHNQNRNNVAAVDLESGLPTEWNPNVTGNVTAMVEALTILEGQVYLGGLFTDVNGQARKNLASVGIRNGTVSGWNPDLSSFSNGIVDALKVYNGTLYVGGQFEKVGSWSISNFAAFGRKSSLPNLIQGSIFADENGDCRKNDGERGLPGVVKAEPGSYYGFADSLGNYAIAVDTGTYTVAQMLPVVPGKATSQTCPVSPATYVVPFKTYGNTVTGKDFGNRITLRPYLTTNVTSTRRRRCFAANTTILYCNEGSLAAKGVKVHLALPEHVVLVSASLPYTRDKDQYYVFNVGNLPAGHCRTIQVQDSVVCNNPDIRGLTQCTKVWITPANATTPAAGWDGSDVALKAKCLTNGRVRLGLYNTGSGAMTDSSAYRVLLDAKLVLSRNFKLAAGDSLLLQVPANGQTVRLEAGQRPGHPTKQSTNVTLEGCGTGAGGKVSLGFVSQLPADDAEPEVDVECLPITDSFDPNDKLVLPAGITSEHLTAFGQELEYTIRFQNTGNDYAYRVVLVDTLSDKLDVSTLRVAGASHPYKFTVSGKGRPVLTWTFDNINLPDSARDQAGSNGFVKFTIKPLEGLPEGTRLENSADIFFDYNPPVRTNTVFNTLGVLPTVVSGGDAVIVTVCQPNLPVSAGPDRSFCDQDTVQLQAQLPRYGQGHWKRISGAGTLGEPTNPHGTVSGLGPGANVFEWSIADGSCAADSLRYRVTITRYASPQKPTIAYVGATGLMSSTEGLHYQWYYNGRLLPDNTQTIEATRGGSYAVSAGNDQCVSAPSDPYAFELTGAVLDRLVKVQPNPTAGLFAIVLPEGVGQVTCTVFDALGRKVLQSVATVTAGKGLLQHFDLRPNGAGVYLVKIEMGQAVLVKRVVVSR